MLNGLDTGFSAYPLVDPVVVADVNNSRSLTSADVLILARELNWLTTGMASNDRPEIPAIPSNIDLPDAIGPDPLVDIPRDLSVFAGGVLTVPVRLDTAAGLESVQLQLAWNPAELELIGVRRGSLTGDFQYFVARQEADSLLVDMSRLELMQGGQGTVLELDFRAAASAVGSVNIDLQWARLNDTRLTLNPAPQFGSDPTDGVVSVVGTQIETVGPADTNVAIQADADAQPTDTARETAALLRTLFTGQPAVGALLSTAVSDIVIDLGARYDGFAFTYGGDRCWFSDLVKADGNGDTRKDAPNGNKQAGKPDLFRKDLLKRASPAVRR